MWHTDSFLGYKRKDGGEHFEKQNWEISSCCDVPTMHITAAAAKTLAELSRKYIEECVLRLVSTDQSDQAWALKRQTLKIKSFQTGGAEEPQHDIF